MDRIKTLSASILIVLICMSIPATTKAQNNKYHTLYYQRASLFEELPIDSNDIVFLGNSITHFGEWHELLDNPNIKNRGISGDIVQGVYDRLEPIIKGSPAKIFLLIGINDVSHDVTADSIINATEKLVKEIIDRSPETTLYIQSVFPVNPDFDMFQKATTRGDVVIEINKGLRNISSKHDIQYIDVYSALKCQENDKLNPEFTNDGLHLLGKGYIKWAEIIRNYL
jgi:lysophospholipase L1-like esterase